MRRASTTSPGFIVGVVDRDRVIDGRHLAAGDRLIGIPSTGLHTNGYSLARLVLFDRLGLGVDEYVPALGATVGDALLRVHRSYLPLVRPLLAAELVLAMAHITGGGLTDNLPRVFPPGLGAEIDLSAWEPPPLFRFIQTAGAVPLDEMLRTFNMGIGLVVAAGERRRPPCSTRWPRRARREALHDWPGGRRRRRLSAYAGRP